MSISQKLMSAKSGVVTNWDTWDHSQDGSVTNLSVGGVSTNDSQYVMTTESKGILFSCTALNDSFNAQLIEVTGDTITRTGNLIQITPEVDGYGSPGATKMGEDLAFVIYERIPNTWWYYVIDTSGTSPVVLASGSLYSPSNDDFVLRQVAYFEEGKVLVVGDVTSGTSHDWWVFTWNGSTISRTRNVNPAGTNLTPYNFFADVRNGYLAMVSTQTYLRTAVIACPATTISVAVSDDLWPTSGRIYDKASSSAIPTAAWITDDRFIIAATCYDSTANKGWVEVFLWSWNGSSLTLLDKHDLDQINTGQSNTPRQVACVGVDENKKLAFVAYMNDGGSSPQDVKGVVISIDGDVITEITSTYLLHTSGRSSGLIVEKLTPDRLLVMNMHYHQEAQIINGA